MVTAYTSGRIKAAVALEEARDKLLSIKSYSFLSAKDRDGIHEALDIIEGLTNKVMRVGTEDV